MWDVHWLNIRKWKYGTATWGYYIMSAPLLYHLDYWLLWLKQIGTNINNYTLIYNPLPPWASTTIPYPYLQPAPWALHLIFLWTFTRRLSRVSSNKERYDNPTLIDRKNKERYYNPPLIDRKKVPHSLLNKQTSHNKLGVEETVDSYIEKTVLTKHDLDEIGHLLTTLGFYFLWL